MDLTPAYLTSVASFYDMVALAPKPKNDVYVCTNISCSLLGADELHEAFLELAHLDPDLNVCSFECLGACDIAPMASVNGEYVGPLTGDDARRIVADLKADRPVLPDKQLRYRRCADVERGQQRDDDRTDPVQGHRRARAEHARGVRAAWRLPGAAQGARDAA